MEIIQDNYRGSAPNVVNVQQFDVQCEHCDSVVRVTDDELDTTALGLCTFECPCCGKTSDIDGLEYDLSYDKVQFPKHWFVHNNGIRDKLSVDEWLQSSQKYLSEAIKTLYNDLKEIKIPEDSDEETCRRYFMGDTILIMSKYRDESDCTKYRYDLDIVKQLADTTISDRFQLMDYRK